MTAAIYLAIAVMAALPLAAPRVAREDVALGVTFSPRYATSLGLDPRTVYVRLLDELGVREVRLPIYWDEVEPVPGAYDFSREDFYLAEAERRGLAVIPVLGHKVPRWPECFAPAWAESLETPEKRAAILRLVRAEVEHVRRFRSVATWQVENEPFFPFGHCGDFGTLDEAFVTQELAIVRELDARPVLITDSGEFSTWLSALRLADRFGSTMYRAIWFERFGLIPYPIPPWLYAAKDRIARALVGADGESIVAELQAEPWFMTGGSITEVPVPRQVDMFPSTMLPEHVLYARDTGFSAIHLWGVEWWYWMEAQGYPEYLEAARGVFRRGDE